MIIWPVSELNYLLESYTDGEEMRIIIDSGNDMCEVYFHGETHYARCSESDGVRYVVMTEDLLDIVNEIKEGSE